MFFLLLLATYNNHNEKINWQEIRKSHLNKRTQK